MKQAVGFNGAALGSLVMLVVARSPMSGDATQTEPLSLIVSETPTGKFINQIREWQCHFDGTNPFDFLERVDELRAAYGYNEQHLLLGLPEMLRGEPLLWYRNNRKNWQCWKDFYSDLEKKYIPSPDQLRHEINVRKQKQGESYAKYATDMETMMRRLGGYSSTEQAEILYANLQAKYKIYVRRDGARNLRTLETRATEYEDI